MKGSESGEHLGKQATHSVNVKRCLVGIDICLPVLQSLEVAASQNVQTLCSTALRRQRLLATMLHRVQCAAGKPFRYPVLGALWDTLVIKETLVQFWIHKDFISEITRVLRSLVWHVFAARCGQGWIILVCPIPLPPLRLYSPPQTHDKKASLRAPMPSTDSKLPAGSLRNLKLKLGHFK